MPEPDREFLQRLLLTFSGEAEEHIRTISEGLFELEKSPRDEVRAAIVEKIFREAHSLKGAARAVNLRDVETLCQSLEGTLARAKRREIALTTDELDGLHQGVDRIEHLLAGIEKEQPAPARPQTEPPGSPARTPDGTAAEKQLRGAAGTSPAEATVRVPAEQLDRLLLQVEELVPVGMGAAQRSAEVRELARGLSLWKSEWAKLQSVTRPLRQAAQSFPRPLLDFLDWNEQFVRNLGSEVSRLSRSVERDQRALGTMVGSLLRDTKLLPLRPFSSLTESFPRFLRDLCRQQGKEASLAVLGADIEIDRRVLQEIKDPLIHLVRNCIDHGIEKPQQRVLERKPPRGTVSIAIERQSATRVEVAVSDDGAGIDPGKVREAAVRAGIVSAEAAQDLSDLETVALVFQSGVTTSPIVTELSGRGLGMAIVREKVEKLGGEVTLDTRLGEGTTFRLLLPLTVSTMRGVMIRARGQTFVVPASYVEKVAAAKRDFVRTVGNRATVLLGGQPASFVRLSDVLGLSPESAGVQAGGSMTMVVLASAGARIAFEVDEVLGEQEVLVKSLGPQLARVRNVGGAAVLGTGKIALILNVADLMKSAVKAGSASSPAQMPASPSAAVRKSILVVDDSITARTLLKSILEAAGYLVRTAVDGAEAFATLRESRFDLVVSDVDMPRMNGFALTARIRAERKLADLPVILVTALESREDRERGIDAGANAYIVKSSFEQSNLLDVVRRSL